MLFNLPEYIKRVMKRLEDNGFEAYIVGGSVRDLLLGKEPLDFDVATNALPEDIKSIFKDKKTIDIGEKFGTIILVEDENVEITTFRIDGDYLDGRKPQWVKFSSQLVDDLSRRDFTINAIAYNHKVGLVDPFNGRQDLEKKTIKTVGHPNKRFHEDYLRMLRGVRFATSLGFKLDESVFHAIKNNSKNINSISQERIREELFKIVMSEKPSIGLLLLKETLLMDEILPEFIDTYDFDQKNPNHDKDLFNHTLCVVDKTPKVLHIRLAALFHDLGKAKTLSIDEFGIGHFYGHEKISSDMATDILKRLKSSNELIDNVSALIKDHMVHHSSHTDKSLKRLIRRLGQDRVFHLFKLQIADISCTNPKSKYDKILDMEAQVKKIIEDKQPYKIEQMAINGNDLIEIGYKEGVELGNLLKELFAIIEERPELNNREDLMDIVMKKKK